MKIMKPIVFEEKPKVKKYEVKKDVVSEPKEDVKSVQKKEKKTTNKRAPRKVAKKK